MEKRKVCTVCGGISVPKTIVKGSILIEIFLWLSFIFPGVLYSLWRMTTKSKGCKACGSLSMVELDSPVGKKLTAVDIDNLTSVEDAT